MSQFDEDSKILEHTHIEQFYKFNSLPPELRLMIWRLSFPDSCYVEYDTGLWCDCSVSIPIERSQYYPASESRPKTKITESHSCNSPATLKVCRESRDETLKHYVILFKQSDPLLPVYFSPARDTLKIKSLPQFLHNLPNLGPGTTEQLKLMKRLALWAGDWFWSHKLGLWQHFPMVEELILVDDIKRGGLKECRDMLVEHKISGRRNEGKIQTIILLN
jgi:hypothetical protein